MKNRLMKEIAKTIRALTEFGAAWEKHFPEHEGNGSRTAARTTRRRFAQMIQPIQERRTYATKY